MYNLKTKTFRYFEQLTNLCDSFPQDLFKGVVIVDREGIIQYSDKKHSALFGRTQEEEIGNNILSLNDCRAFPQVINSCAPFISKLFLVKGKTFIGSVIPLTTKSEVVGAMGIILSENIATRQSKGLIDLDENDVEFCNLQNEAVKKVNGNISFNDIIGESNALKKSKELASKASKLDLPVLLTGETGTGKTMFAKAIHNSSLRKNNPFISINCSAIPKDLFETELFGYAPGAFSGCSSKGKPGKFEMSHHGTLFLDEIMNLPLEFQVKILDVLQERQVARIGGVHCLNVDFRLISASSEELEKMIQESLFRADLYFRINVIRIHLSPLRERKEDIPILIEYKLKEIMERYKLREKIEIGKDVIEYLTEYPFPGNHRELFNFLEQSILHLNCSKITEESLSLLMKARSNDPPRKTPISLSIVIEEAEKEAINNVLKLTSGDIADAARILEIHRTTLYKKIGKFGIHYMP